MSHAAIRGGGCEYLGDPLLRFLDFGFDSGHMVVFFEVLEKVAHIQEGVAIEADVHKGRLHSR